MMWGCRALWLILIVGAVGCGGSHPSPTKSEAELVVESRSAYVPKVGTTRAEVEAILGEPTHQSHTKTGLIQAMYEVQRARYRSVVYTDAGRVAYAVPAMPLQPINLKYED